MPSNLKILFENQIAKKPLVSIVLIDWSCRESFHTFRYLNDQTADRDKYELIWVEYYSRSAPEIETALKESESAGKHPIVDKWIEIGVPKSVYYHKHLMYNVGLVASNGEIITFCDSDAIATPTFVESILRSFEDDKEIVLHMDEVRNYDRKFYPFRYPPLEEIRKGAINFKKGKTTGLFDKEDRLHTLNYGACMSARRADLIEIGGADEHIDYLGHVCGPYEMTFRLVNAGKKEVWHDREFLYHVWHPGTDGTGNYCGPHDGRNVSSTALEAKKTGRVMPLAENQAVRRLRLKDDDILYEPLLNQAIPEEEIKRWDIDLVFTGRRSFWRLDSFFRKPLLSIRLTVTFLKMLSRHFYVKLKKFTRHPDSYNDILRKMYKTYVFFKNTVEYNNYVIEKCNLCIKRLVADNITRFALFGTNEVAEVFYRLASDSSLKIDAIYDYIEDRDFFDFKVSPPEAAKDYGGKVVVAATASSDEAVKVLKDLGVMAEAIILM